MTPKELRKRYQGKYFRRKDFHNITLYLYIKRVNVESCGPDVMPSYIDYIYYSKSEDKIIKHSSTLWCPQQFIMEEMFEKIKKEEYHNILKKKRWS